MSRRFLAAALTAIVVAGLANASPARALVQTFTTLNGGSLTVRTANGASWQLTLGVNPNGDGETSELSETLSRVQRKPVSTVETHMWTDSIPLSSLTFDPNSGDGTLTTPQSVSSLTVLNLTFTTTSRHNAACSSGSKTLYFGTLTGQATLHTQLHAGGTVGGQHVSFSSGRNEIISDTGCQTTSSPPSACSKGVLFEADASSQNLGGHGAPNAVVQLGHGVDLNKPAGAARQDNFSSASSHAPVLNAKKHVFQVWAAASGAFTGTGRFTGGKLSTFAGDCVKNGVHHTEHAREYAGATFTNGANHPLVAHTSLVGKLTMPKTKQTIYEFGTFS